MIARTATTTKHAKPTRRPCSLLEECRVEIGGAADFKLLAKYHYRGTGFPPAVHRIYRALHVPSRRVVGVTVYAAPALNLGMRNKIFGDRYKIGGARGAANEACAARLNEEFELRIRTIVHPTFRGVGLAQRLVRETVIRRPYQFIEGSAAMGTINPFAAKGGMTAILVPRPPNTERCLAALRSVGMTEAEMGNPAEMLRSIERLPDQSRRRVEAELERYAMRWIKSRTKREVKMSTEIAVRRVASMALLQTTYYLWENPAMAVDRAHGLLAGDRMTLNDKRITLALREGRAVRVVVDGDERGAPASVEAFETLLAAVNAQAA